MFAYWATPLGVLPVLLLLSWNLIGSRKTSHPEACTGKGISKIHIWSGQELRWAGSIFASGMLFGILGGIVFLPEDHESRSLVAKVGPTQPLTPAAFRHLWWFYFSINLRAALISIGVGTIGRYAPLLVIGMNGAFEGAFLAAVVLLPDARLGATLLTMMPHALIEVSAILLAAVIGMQIPLVSIGMGFRGRVLTLFRSWPKIVVLSLVLALSAGLEVLSWSYPRPGSAGVLPYPWMSGGQN